MSRFLLVLCGFILNLSAFADNLIWPVRVRGTQNIEGGVGSDYIQLGLVHTMESELTNGTYFVKFNYVTQQLADIKLPEVFIEQKCEFRRASGGRIGDYKPKNIGLSVRLGNTFGSTYFWASGLDGDHNDNPARKRYSINSPFGLSNVSRERLASECGVGARKVQLMWWLQGDCRWKPENWFKPENFPFEYRVGGSVQNDPRIVREVKLICVGR